MSSSDFECDGPVGPVGTLPPCDSMTELFPIVPAGELLSVDAVPFPDGRDPVITQSPAEMLVGDSHRAVPGVIGDPAVVAMVGLDVMRMGEDTLLDCVGKCAEWDIRNDFETIDGMPVYYGGDLCDSD